MLVGNTEIKREQMPSFVDFTNNPKHLYNLMQDQLNQGLQVQALQQQNQMQQNVQNNQGK